MAQLYSDYPPFWNLNTERHTESLPKSLSLRLETSQHPSQKIGQISFQLHDHPDSSLSQSTQSNHEMAFTGGTNSPDQCISSESGQEVSCGNSSEQRAKPFFLFGQPNGASRAAQINFNHMMACVPYPITDPCYSGLLAAHGPSPLIQPQMVGMTPTRLPLPLDSIAADEPIYVNAKQYHGILRRRQSRAKLEAQNKLIKARKPYLHESRHRHALNRVRGSGGRFLGSKELQQGASDSTRRDDRSVIGSGFGRSHSITTDRLTENPINSSANMPRSHLPKGNSVFQRPEHGYPNISVSSHFDDGSMLHNGSSNQHYSPFIR
ncbi:hypothetical protein Droror1_Dr00005960 [Drosera rotundifolia]